MPEEKDKYSQETTAVTPDKTRSTEANNSNWNSNSSLRLYMRDLGKIPLLTPEEEVSLAKRIQKGDLEAREYMIKANLRLVVKIAKDYEGLGLPLLDLINEGNLGLMKGIAKYDPSKGVRFSTYGAFWIKQNIRRAISNHSKTIRLPIHLEEKISKMKEFIEQYKHTNGNEPDDEVLAQELQMPVNKVVLLRESSMSTVSLDAPFGDDGSTSLGDVLGDESIQQPDQRMEQKTMRHILLEVLSTLEPREQGILRYRFGLETGEEKSLEEVGKKFNVTRERVRQIQNQALSKMRMQIQMMENSK